MCATTGRECTDEAAQHGHANAGRPGVLRPDLAWYHFDVSGGNVTFSGGGSFFAGWTSDDWLTRKGDKTDPDSRTLKNTFGTGWDDPADPLPTSNYDALIRVTVTPEPGTCAMALMAFGLAGAYVRRRRKS